MMGEPVEMVGQKPTTSVSNQCCPLKKRWKLAACAAAEDETAESAGEMRKPTSKQSDGSATPTTGVRETSPTSINDQQTSSRVSSDAENQQSPQKTNFNQQQDLNEVARSTEKELKKKQTQQCIKMIKHLLHVKIGADISKTDSRQQKMNTVEALNNVIELLKSEISQYKKDCNLPTCVYPIPNDDDVVMAVANKLETKVVLLDVVDKFMVVEYPTMIIKNISEPLLKDFQQFNIKGVSTNTALQKVLKPIDCPPLFTFMTNNLHKTDNSSTPGCVFARFRCQETGSECTVQIDQCCSHTSPLDNTPGGYSTPPQVHTVKLLMKPLNCEQGKKNRLLSFRTRHSPMLNITAASADVVESLGYLPQDLVGRSLVSFINRDDLVILEDVHELLISHCAQPIRSAPFRFRLGDGREEAIVDTEWSSFINPWTRKVEFVVANHTVIRGPVDPSAQLRYASDTADRLQKQCQASSRTIALTSRIVNMLSEPCQKKHRSKNQPSLPHEPCKMDVGESDSLALKRGGPEARGGGGRGVKRGANNDMGTFLDQLVESIVHATANSPPKVARQHNAEFPSPSNRQEGIGPSPIGSNEVLSGSPPDSGGSLSYSTINYLEKVHRLLQSQPKDNEATSTSPQHHTQQTINEQQQAVPHENMPLTRELLQQHTRNWEKEYKRRYSSELATAAHNSMHNNNNNNKKNNNEQQWSLKPPSRLPNSTQFDPNPVPAGPVTSSVPGTAGHLWSSLQLPLPPQANLPPQASNPKIVAPTPRPAGMSHAYSSSELYYRALGPNPPPPPGRNFQVTVAPLPARSSAFAPTGPSPQFATADLRRNSGAGLDPGGQGGAINLTVGANANMSKIPAIQNISPPINNQPWPAQSMDIGWPPYRNELSLSEQLIMRYRNADTPNNNNNNNNNGNTQQTHQLQTHQLNHAYSVPNSMGINPHVSNLATIHHTPKHTFYDMLPKSTALQNFESGSSAVKEATDALMLLQET